MVMLITAPDSRAPWRKSVSCVVRGWSFSTIAPVTGSIMLTSPRLVARSDCVVLASNSPRTV
jgi:hypothetical protein